MQQSHPEPLLELLFSNDDDVEESIQVPPPQPPPVPVARVVKPTEEEKRRCRELYLQHPLYLGPAHRTQVNSVNKSMAENEELRPYNNNNNNNSILGFMKQINKPPLRRPIATLRPASKRVLGETSFFFDDDFLYNNITTKNKRLYVAC